MTSHDAESAHRQKPRWIHGDDSTACPNVDDTWTCVEHGRPVFARTDDAPVPPASTPEEGL